MFSECSSLKELNLSNFNTKKCEDFSDMFYGCSSLKKLNIFYFNAKNVITFGMFEGCSKELKMKIKAKYKNIDIFAFNSPIHKITGPFLNIKKLKNN